MSDAISALRSQTEAARALLANMADILGDDAELVASTVEGETDLHEVIALGLKRYRELDALRTGIMIMQNDLSVRIGRFDQQSETLRTAIMTAMDAGQMKKFEHALGTISLRNVPPKAIITDEAQIPSSFWKPSDPKLDKKAVLDALKANETVPGAQLSNGSQTIQVKLT
jgi:hypothetical protein